jgi:hypothetical protein
MWIPSVGYSFLQANRFSRFLYTQVSSCISRIFADDDESDWLTLFDATSPFNVLEQHCVQQVLELQMPDTSGWNRCIKEDAIDFNMWYTKLAPTQFTTIKFPVAFHDSHLVDDNIKQGAISNQGNHLDAVLSNSQISQFRHEFLSQQITASHMMTDPPTTLKRKRIIVQVHIRSDAGEKEIRVFLRSLLSAYYGDPKVSLSTYNFVVDVRIDATSLPSRHTLADRNSMLSFLSQYFEWQFGKVDFILPANLTQSSIGDYFTFSHKRNSYNVYYATSSWHLLVDTSFNMPRYWLSHLYQVQLGLNVSIPSTAAISIFPSFPGPDHEELLHRAAFTQFSHTQHFHLNNDDRRRYLLREFYSSLSVPSIYFSQYVSVGLGLLGLLIEDSTLREYDKWRKQWLASNTCMEYDAQRFQRWILRNHQLIMYPLSETLIVTDASSKVATGSSSLSSNKFSTDPTSPLKLQSHSSFLTLPIFDATLQSVSSYFALRERNRLWNHFHNTEVCALALPLSKFDRTSTPSI